MMICPIFALDIAPTIVANQLTGVGRPAKKIVLHGDYAFLLTRGIDIIDVQNPLKPEFVATVGTGNLDLAVSGNYCFVAGRSGLEIFDISNPAAPNPINTFTGGIETKRIAVSGQYAYLMAGNGLAVLDVANPTSPRIVKQEPMRTGSIAIAGSYLYVGTAHLEWLKIFDLSTPGDPQLIATVPGAQGTFDLALEIKVEGPLAHIADHAEGIAFVDVSDPKQPRRLASLKSGLGYGVAPLGNLALLANGTGLAVFDITKPVEPQFKAGVNIKGAISVAAKGSYAFVAGEKGMTVVDLEQPVNPQRIATVQTGGVARGLAVSDGAAYVASGTAGLKVCSLDNESEPQVIGSLDVPGEAHDVAIAGHYAYVAAASQGLLVVDVRDKTHPQAITTLPTDFSAVRVAILGNYAYVTGDTTLHVADISTPDKPRWVAVTTNSDWYGIMDLAISGGIIFAATDRAGMQIYEPFQNGGVQRLSKQLAGTLTIQGSSIAVSGDYAYLTGRSGGLRIVDVRDPVNPLVLASVPNSNAASDVVVLGKHAYVSNSGSGLQVIDISDPRNPRQVGANGTFRGNAIAAYDQKILIATDTQGLVITSLLKPLLLQAQLDLKNGYFQALISGGIGQMMRVQRSRDFKQWEDWNTIKLESSPTVLTDTNSASERWTFYQVVSP